MAKISPSGVNSASYTPTNSPQACPSIDSTWEASSNLPPTPNADLCSCMVANLTCVAKPDISSSDTQTNLDYLCGPGVGDYCAGITPNATTGKYGSYSMCNATEKLSWAMNEFYKNQTANNPKNNNPCDFKGVATKKTPNSQNSCKALVSQAGPAGTGTVTSAPSATGAGSSSTPKGAAGATTVPKFSLGLLQLAVYVVTAGLVGAGMVFL